jgi:hypothetical protein
LKKKYTDTFYKKGCIITLKKEYMTIIKQKRIHTDIFIEKIIYDNIEKRIYDNIEKRIYDNN